MASPERLLRGGLFDSAVEQAGVCKIDLRRFDLPLAEVLGPGLEDAHHERRRKDIEVAANPVIRHADGAGELRRVPDLAVVVSQHGPEAPQGGGGNREAELR